MLRDNGKGPGPETLLLDVFSCVQGGCMALEDAVTLAATLRNASRAKGARVADAFARTEPAVLAAALRDMERERTTRCAPLVQMAHDNGESTCMPKSLPVRACFAHRMEPNLA